jgi:dephospho-CoA kinase
MRVVGLTGGIASGKSTVSNLLRQLGAVVIDADRIARRVVEPDRRAWKRIVGRFGPEILLPDRTLDRKGLAERIFRSAPERRFLNRVTHPPIYWEILKSLARHWWMKTPLVVVDAALLFETPLRLFLKPIVVVYADADTQLERLVRRDGIDREEAMRKIRAQMPLEEKKKLADYVIDNSGSLERTAEQVHDLWRRLAPGRGAASPHS